jgi:hypothetical protein
MNLANMAPGRTPWGGFGPEGLPALLQEGSGLSLRLSFDWTAPMPLAGPWMPEAWDSSRHGAELAALLALFQTEAGFLPLAEEDAPPPAAQGWPSVSPPPSAMILPPEGLPAASGPDFLATGALLAAPIPPAPDWLML